MTAEWARWCAAPDLSPDDAAIRVTVAVGRQHRVRVRDAGEVYELSAVSVRAAVVEELDVEVRSLMWLKNRRSPLVGFRIDEKGRLVAEAWVPKVGLTVDEFQLYVRRVATEADRLEFAITGGDRE